METVYVSPTGKAANAGTQDSPMDILAGLSAVAADGMLYLMDGIYRDADTYTLKCGTVQAAKGARPVLTSPDDTPPTVDCDCNVNGIWMGGTRDKTANSVIYVKDGRQFTNNTVFGYYGGIAEGGHKNILYQSNRFVNCGGGGKYHDIYISAENSSAKVYDNIHIGGEGYKIHLWHYATNADIQGNFLAEYYYGTVLQHATHSAVDNILWNHTPPVDSWMTVNIGAGTFNHNLFGHRTFGTGKWGHDLNGETGLTVDRLGLIGDRYTDTNTWPGDSVAVGPYNGDGDVLPGAGTNYTHYAVTDLPALLGYSEAQIDAAVAALIASFAEDLQTIHDDATIEGNFAIFRAVVDAWKAA